MFSRAYLFTAGGLGGGCLWSKVLSRDESDRHGVKVNGKVCEFIPKKIKWLAPDQWSCTD